MFSIVVSDSPEILVNTRSKSIRFAIDASGMNPLEAFYATLAGCAAVYAKKACKELGLSAEGITVNCRPSAGKAGPLSLGRFETTLGFPAHFSSEAVAHVVRAVEHCAVKEVVKDGPAIEFSVVALTR